MRSSSTAASESMHRWMRGVSSHWGRWVMRWVVRWVVRGEWMAKGMRRMAEVVWRMTKMMWGMAERMRWWWLLHEVEWGLKHKGFFLGLMGF